MTDSQGDGKGRPFELWMLAGVAGGAAFNAFAILLIPPYVTQMTGNARVSGILISVLSLAAVLGPVVGRFADKYKAHRLVLSLSVLGLALGFALFALMSRNLELYILPSILLGISMAGRGVLGGTYVVGAKLPKELEAKQLTVLNLLNPAGMVLGGAMMGAAIAAGWSYPQRFWLAAAFLFVLFIFVWGGSAKATRRLHATMYDPTTPNETDQKATVDSADHPSLKNILLSNFGLFTLIMILSSINNNGVGSQIANIMPNVYGFSDVATASLVALAGVLSMVASLAGGAWMVRSDPMTVYFGGVCMRLVGALGLALVGMLAGSPLILAAAFMMILYMGVPVARLAQGPIGYRFAIVQAGEAVGFIYGASALGAFFGSLLAGFAADAFGFNAVNWMGAIAGGLAVILIIFRMWPSWRQNEAELDSDDDFIKTVRDQSNMKEV
jgi:MFS family permease